MEQLQQTLNKAIEMWWKPRNIKSVSEAFTQEWWMTIKFYDDWTDYCDRWYHDLFSKDSWVMELVHWKEPPKFFLPMTYENEENKKYIWLNYHYRKMWTMTAQEKIDYFNENAYL